MNLLTTKNDSAEQLAVNVKSRQQPLNGRYNIYIHTQHDVQNDKFKIMATNAVGDLLTGVSFGPILDPIKLKDIHLEAIGELIHDLKILGYSAENTSYFLKDGEHNVAITSSIQNGEYVQHTGDAERTVPAEIPASPPHFAERLISLLTPREKREELLAQLAEYYADVAEEYGPRWANWHYCAEVARSLTPVLGRSIEWFVKRKMLFQFLGKLLEMWRSHAG